MIDGFYEKIDPPLQKELQLLANIPLEEKRVKRSLGLKVFLQQRTGRDATKELLFSPTCSINGLITGYTGEGSKTVLPKEAKAKLDFRLVPKQMPDEIFQKLTTHLHNAGHKNVEVIRHGSTEPAKTPVDDDFVEVVIRAAEKVYEKKPIIYPTSPASGPMHLFRNLLKSPVVSAGCSHAEAKGHAPNENLTIDGFIKGIKFMATILDDFS